MARKITVLGIPFYNTKLQEMVSELTDRIDSQQKTFVVTANPEIVMKAYDDPSFKAHITQADYITADGIGVVKATEHLKEPLPERVTGFDMFQNLLERGNAKGYSLYLVGGTEEVINKTHKVVRSSYPNINLKGSHSGFFETTTERCDVQKAIIDSKVDMVFVAMGSPYQETFITEILPQIQKGLFMGIGGSFDVLSGTVKRAPLFWQKLGLEWFYRLASQPTRLWRMKDLVRFYLAARKEAKR